VPRCFTQVQSAIDTAPKNSPVPFKIKIAAGEYREKIIIDKPYIYLIGESHTRVRIFFDDYAGKEISTGKTLSTYGSATLTVSSHNILLQSLIIENSFDYLANDALPNDAPQKIAGAQAVALYADTTSDRLQVRKVNLLGYQDTLFVDGGRSWFDQVLVAGNVDFIFGAGNALFTASEIRTRTRGKLIRPHGYITAPSTDIASAYGFTFVDCQLTRELGVPDNAMALGRPWHPSKNFEDGFYADPGAIGKTVFINTWMDSHVMQEGWGAMSGKNKTGEKQYFQPESARFFEYKNSGVGALVNEKRRQLTQADAKDYTREKILAGWLP
jgi:pectinesterase